MGFKIISDSSCDLTNNDKKNMEVEISPFKMSLGNVEFTDNEDLDVSDFIAKMNKYDGQAKSSCPSPHEYIEKFDKAVTNFVVTISSQLSGSFMSANVAKDMFEEQGGDVHVFDSKSASVAQYLIILKIREFIDEGLEKFEIIKRVDGFISNMRTLFVLENLDNLIKNGRMGKLTGLIAGVFNIKPILGADVNGRITLLSKARGSQQAIQKLVDMVGDICKDTTNKILAISHCNNPELADHLKNLVHEKYSFKDILVLKTRGLSGMYANEGGIIIAF